MGRDVIMFKNKLLFPIVLSLAILLSGSGGFTAEAVGANLLDIDEHWAQQYIAEMYASEIVTGYPGGFYQPDQSVTRLEVLTMLIRALGQEDQAKNLASETVDYYVSPPDWGRGYLIWGVQRGMLDKNLLEQMAGQATRAEVAALVCGALEIGPVSDELTFEDVDQIASNYRGLVSAVVGLKIMQGFPGNIFKPNDEITRAQMAVILSRIVDYRPSDIFSARRLSGTISEIEPVNGLIAIRQDSNRFLTSDCEVFLNGKIATPDDLMAGDQAKLILDDYGQVVFVKAVRESVADTNEYKGTVDKLFLIGEEYWLTITSFEGQSMTRPVSSGVYVNDSGAQMDITWLSRGKYIEIGLADNKIITIDSLEISILKGTIKSVSSSYLTLLENSDKKTRLEVAGNVVVIKDDRTSAYEDVRVGSWAEVTVCDKKVVKIDIPSFGNVEGTIKELDTSGVYGIIIRDGDGDIEDYVVDSDVEVRRDGSSIDFDELDTGEQVKLELDRDDRVIYIEVTGSGNLEGIIRELDTRGTYGITIRNDDGDDEDYVVDSDVEVRRDGSSIDFDELDTGERVRLDVDSDDLVTNIEVIDSDDLEGEIRELDTSGTYGITIRDDDDDDEDYVVDSDVVVWRRNSRIDFDELDTGERVRLGLNSRGRVTYIEVVSASSSATTTISGKVVELVTGRSPLIRIQKSSGTKSQYDLEDDVDYYRDGESIALEDIVIGSEVEVRLKNREIVKIEVTDDENITLEGTVTYVNTGSEKIRIEQVSGNSFIYYLADNAKLIGLYGDSIDLEDIDVDWEVELELRDGEIYRLTRQ
jgi:RNA-binding protein YhbY